MDHAGIKAFKEYIAAKYIGIVPKVNKIDRLKACLDALSICKISYFEEYSRDFKTYHEII